MAFRCWLNWAEARFSRRRSSEKNLQISPLKFFSFSTAALPICFMRFICLVNAMVADEHINGRVRYVLLVMLGEGVYLTSARHLLSHSNFLATYALEH